MIEDDPIKRLTLPENLLSRRMPNRWKQAETMKANPKLGLNFGGIRSGAGRRGASFGRVNQINAPDATKKG